MRLRPRGAGERVVSAVDTQAAVTGGRGGDRKEDGGVFCGDGRTCPTSVSEAVLVKPAVRLMS